MANGVASFAPAVEMPPRRSPPPCSPGGRPRPSAERRAFRIRRTLGERGGHRGARSRPDPRAAAEGLRGDPGLRMTLRRQRRRDPAVPRGTPSNRLVSRRRNEKAVGRRRRPKVGLPGLEPGTSSLSEKQDAFPEVSDPREMPANARILRAALFPSFQGIRLGCCTVAAHPDVSRRRSRSRIQRASAKDLGTILVHPSA